MNDLQDNPYASPLEAGSPRPHERSKAWQHDVSHAVKLVPWATAYHPALYLLNLLSDIASEYNVILSITILVGVLTYSLALVYYAWFAGLLYGPIWGILLSPLASFH
jgi:hypothetical protein